MTSKRFRKILRKAGVDSDKATGIITASIKAEYMLRKRRYKDKNELVCINKVV